MAIKQNEEFHLKMRKDFFTLSMAEHWNWLSREVMECLSLERFKPHLDVFLCKLFQVTAFLGRGGGLDNLQRSLPAPTEL